MFKKLNIQETDAIAQAIAKDIAERNLSEGYNNAIIHVYISTNPENIEVYATFGLNVQIMDDGRTKQYIICNNMGFSILNSFIANPDPYEIALLIQKIENILNE